MRVVHAVVPAGIDDPAQPSGGNGYDRRVLQGLRAAGWLVHEYAVPGTWPEPTADAYASLGTVVAGIPDGAVVLIDGLIGSAAPEILVPAADRLRLVVLVHMPLGALGDTGKREHAVLEAAHAVVVTSGWTRRRLVEWYGLAEVHVAEPGVDPAELAVGTPGGTRLLCVAAVAPHKGHDTLLTALATVEHLPWQCTFVGSLARDPDFVASLRRQAATAQLADRLSFAGVRTGADLDAAYAGADVLLLASPAETYGMVVTEALARGLPVIATAVGGVPGALGHGADHRRPGLLVRPGDPAGLGRALCGWLTDAPLRERLRRAAGERRATLTGWSVTSAEIARVLAGVAG